MKKRFLLFCLLASVQILSACSLYKLTQNGKTIVGNNEDWFSPNSQIWFLPKGEKSYGVMHVGFINGFPQGGINEAGLMFDGFAMDYLAVTDTLGKIRTPLGEAVTHAMQSFDNVVSVKDYLQKINLSDLATGMIVFVDRSGKYLIAEGDQLIIGDDSERIFSNFYPSLTETANIPFYQKGVEYINRSESENSFDYCSSVMNAMQQDITQYSTVYDLDKLTIRLYYFQDWKKYEEIDLIAELKKGERAISIPELFPDNKSGTAYFTIYNDTKNSTAYLKNLFQENYSHLNGNDLENAKQGFANYINIIGYEWLYDKKDTKGAIAIFKYGTELIPNNANLFDSLGEAFYESKNYEAALKNYKQSLHLNPDNENAIRIIKDLENK